MSLRARPNYKPQRNHRVKNRDKVITNTKWLRLEQPISSPFQAFPQVMNSIVLGNDEFVPWEMNGVQVEEKQLISGTNKKLFAIMDVKYSAVIEEDRLIDLENLHKEDYYDIIQGNEEPLLAINFITTHDLKANKIDDVLKIYSYRVGDPVFCNPLIICAHNTRCDCAQDKRLIPGKITEFHPPEYWPQMKPPYTFTADNPNDSKFNGTIYEKQINSKGFYEDITIILCVGDKMLRCIRAESNKYIISSYIANPPLYLNITSSFFGKQDELEYFQNILNDAHHYRPKSITYCYLKNSIQKALKLKINKNVTTVTLARTSAKEKPLLQNATYIDPYSMDKLLVHLKSDDIELDCNVKNIKWELSVLWISEKLNIPITIIQNDDTSEIRLKKDFKLVMLFDRKGSSILCEKFKYFAVNRDVVRVEREIATESNNNN